MIGRWLSAVLYPIGTHWIIPSKACISRRASSPTPADILCVCCTLDSLFENYLDYQDLLEQEALCGQRLPPLTNATLLQFAVVLSHRNSSWDNPFLAAAASKNSFFGSCLTVCYRKIAVTVWQFVIVKLLWDKKFAKEVKLRGFDASSTYQLQLPTL